MAEQQVPARPAIRVEDIEGWGVDADDSNDPTFPMRNRRDNDVPRIWSRPPLQPPEVEILQSIEHIRLPATFGTARPPRGLSGVLRRLAFRYSESNWWHWLGLMAADRVDVVEGLVEDVAGGRLPNIPAEMGVRAELQHNKAGLVKKVAVVAAVGAAALIAFRWHSSRPRMQEASLDRDRGHGSQPEQGEGQ